MKTIGIKLADGTFYPILEEGEPKTRKLDLTTAKDNQTKVQIDLYRSELGTMEDAEYVDTLEVTKLNPHPNGEPDLHLSVSIDEHNELKAEVIDAETGEKSETQVHLVSRTLAERENADVDFSLPETAIAPSELAALEAQEHTEEPAAEDFSFDDLTDDEFAANEAKKVAEESAEAEKEFDTEAESAALAATTSLDDISLDLPSFDDLDAAETEQGLSDFDTDLSPEAEKSDDLLDVPDFVLDTDTAPEKSLPATEAEAAPADGPSMSDFALDVPEFSTESFDAEKTDTADDFALDNTTSDFALDDTPTDFAPTAPASAEKTSLDDISLDLPPLDDFDIAPAKTVPAAEPATTDFALDDTTTDFALDTTPTDFATDTTQAADKTNLDDFSLDLPDFDNTEFDTAATVAAAAPTRAETNADDFSLDLPDFDNTEFDTAATAAATAPTRAETNADDFALDLPDFDTTSFGDDLAVTDSTSELSDDDFSLPDFDNPSTAAAETTGLSGLFDDPIFESDAFTTKSSGNTSSSAMDFSDLYDDETLAGEHSTPYDDEGEEVKKKTRVPVIICVVCAIICIIATLLVLFVIPSKYNLIKSRNTKGQSLEDSGWVKPKAEISLEEGEIPLDVRPVKPEKPAKPQKPATPAKPEKAEPAIPAEKPAPVPAPAETEQPDLNVPSVVVTDAQEDRIVVAPTPNIVPAPAEKPREKKDVRYRIKWGDTLWDISDAYYKNPWKYPKIAKYNKIKNPDLIISGTDILIPED